MANAAGTDTPMSPGQIILSRLAPSTSMTFPSPQDALLFQRSDCEAGGQARHLVEDTEQVDWSNQSDSGARRQTVEMICPCRWIWHPGWLSCGLRQSWRPEVIALRLEGDAEVSKASSHVFKRRVVGGLAHRDWPCGYRAIRGGLRAAPTGAINCVERLRVGKRCTQSAVAIFVSSRATLHHVLIPHKHNLSNASDLLAKIKKNRVSFT